MAGQDFLRFLTGALSGGVQGYRQRKEDTRQDELMQMQRESQELERERVSAAIAAANQQLKASQWGLQQEQEVAAHLKTPFRQVMSQAVGGFPAPGDVGPQMPGVSEAQGYVQGMGPLADLPIGMIPQAADISQLQMGGLQQQLLQQQMADASGQRDIEAGRRGVEAEALGRYTSPMRPEVTALMGGQFAGISPEELGYIQSALPRGGPGAGGADQWSMENSLKLMDLQRRAYEGSFMEGLGVHMQGDPDVRAAYDNLVSMSYARPPSLSQVQALLPPDVFAEINAYAEQKSQADWQSALSGGLGEAPGGVPGGQLLPTGGLMPPPMGGSPGPGLPLPAAADSVLSRDLSAFSPTEQRRETGRGLIEKHPGMANTESLDRILPGSGGQTAFDYIASRIQEMRGASKYKGKSDEELLRIIFEELTASEVLS